PSPARTGCSLRDIVFVTQSEVGGEFRSYTPCILRVKEQACLSQTGMEPTAGEVTRESAGLGTQERGDSGAGRHLSAGPGVHLRAAGHAIVEGDFPRTMAITRHQLLLCAPQIGSPSENVVAVGLGPRSEEHTSELQSRVDIVCRL